MTDAPGLQWVQSASEATAYTRLGALSGMTLAQAIAYCNTHPPWSQMRRCNLLDNGVVSAFYNGGAGCYSDTAVATMGQVMVDIECFDYYTDFTTAGTYIWYIQPHGAGMTVGGSDVTWKTNPAFSRDSVIKDRIFFSAYEGYLNPTTSKLESKAGVQPTATQTIAQFRAAAQLRKGAANYWELQDYLTTSAVQLLYLIEYGGFNSQTLLSAGITNLAAGAGNQSCNTGHTSALGNASGNVAFSAEQEPATTTNAMSYRGIENFYGNIAMFVEGINIKGNYDPWIADHDFATNFEGYAHPYVNSTATPIYNASGSFITDIKVDATFDYGFLPSATGGNATVKLCDVYYTTTGNRVALAGGAWNSTTNGGVFHIDMRSASTVSFRTDGARLMYIG